MKLWDDTELRLLRWFADEGYSQKRTAWFLGRTPAAIALKAAALEIKFKGKSGAPPGNKNAAGKHQAYREAAGRGSQCSDGKYLGGF